MNGFVQMVNYQSARDVAATIAAAEGWPEDSWWTKPDFYANAKGQLHRMRHSRFGRTEMLATSRNVANAPTRVSLFGDEDP